MAWLAECLAVVEVCGVSSAFDVQDVVGLGVAVFVVPLVSAVLAEVVVASEDLACPSLVLGCVVVVGCVVPGH